MRNDFFKLLNRESDVLVLQQIFQRSIFIIFNIIQLKHINYPTTYCRHGQESYP